VQGDVKFEVHEARLSTRISPDERMSARRDLIVQLSQHCFVNRDTLKEVSPTSNRQGNDMHFRGGCTLVIDTQSGEIRYAIRKRITSEARRCRQRDHQQGKRVRMYPGPEPDRTRTFELLHGKDGFAS